MHWIDNELQRRADILFEDEEFCDSCGRIEYADKMQIDRGCYYCKECMEGKDDKRKQAAE